MPDENYSQHPGSYPSPGALTGEPTPTAHPDSALVGGQGSAPSSASPANPIPSNVSPDSNVAGISRAGALGVPADGLPKSVHGTLPTSEGASTINAVAEQIKASNPPPDLADAIQHGYEPHDVPLNGVRNFMIGLVLTVIAALIVVGGILAALVAYDRTQDPIGPPVAVTHPPIPYPLQPSVQHDSVDRDDMQAMRQHVQEVLYGAGQHGDRRWIPITQAMDQVLPMLPVKPESTTQPTAAAQGAEGAEHS